MARFATALCFALLLCLPAAAAPGGAASAAGDPQRRSALERKNDALRKELELAQGNAFYLVVDPSARMLRLMLKGVVLQGYTLSRLAVGIPSAPLHRSAPPDLAGFLAADGSLDPPRERDRFELVVGPGSASDSLPEVPVPPPAEEVYRIPVRFWIRFSGGVAVEIRSRLSEHTSFKQALFDRIWEPLKASFEDLSNRDRDPVRLLLELTRDDAASLYRVLPPDTKLLILPSE